MADILHVYQTFWQVPKQYLYRRSARCLLYKQLLPVRSLLDLLSDIRSVFRHFQNIVECEFARLQVAFKISSTEDRSTRLASIVLRNRCLAARENANWVHFRCYRASAEAFGVSLTSVISAKVNCGVQFCGSNCCGSHVGSAVSRSKTSYKYAPGSTL